MISDSSNSSIKRHLFDENIRSYLGPKGGYNQEIINSASSIDSHLFWYLNNGITIVCKKLTYNSTANPLLKMADFQIVNGAQTSYSLYRANQNPLIDLSQVTVLLRIYETERVDIANKVAIATNSQARIMPRELRSNDAMQIKYEMFFREHEIFYERKKSSEVTETEFLRIDALKCGQVILSYFLREPEKARRESDSIFESRYEFIFRDTWNFKELVWVIRLHDRLENLKTLEANKLPHERDTNLHVLLYGTWFTLMVVRLILQRDKLKPLEMEAVDVDSLIQQSIRTINDVLARSKGLSHYQFFRSTDSRRQVEEQISDAQGDLFFQLPA